jgi:hypothetical protein
LAYFHLDLSDGILACEAAPKADPSRRKYNALVERQ